MPVIRVERFASRKLFETMQTIYQQILSGHQASVFLFSKTVHSINDKVGWPNKFWLVQF